MALELPVAAPPSPPEFRDHRILRCADGGTVCAVVLSVSGLALYRRRGLDGLYRQAGTWLSALCGPSGRLRIVAEIPESLVDEPCAPRGPVIGSVSCVGDRVQASLYVPPDLVVFATHFADVPIVPGAMLVGWATDIARRSGLWTWPGLHVRNLKFRRIVQPGDHLTVSLEADRGREKLQLRIDSAFGAHAFGILSRAGE